MAKNITINKDRILITETVNLYIPLVGWMPFTFTKFDTNALYLKTDPNGSLSVGGYTQCPTFYGQSDAPTSGISDKDNGWFPTDVVSGNVGATTGATVYLDVPQFNSWKFASSTLSYSSPFLSNYLSIFRNSDNTIVGSFRWAVAPIVTGTASDSEGNTYNTTEYRMIPVEISLTSVNAQSTQLRFPAYSPESCYRTVVIDSETGATGIQYFSQINNTTDEWGNQYRIRQTIPFHPWVLMFLKTPTTLSIAVTP